MVDYKTRAKEFSNRWKNKGYEKGETSRFWLDLLQNVYGIENSTNYIFFEEQVELKNKSFIDAIIPTTNVIIEQKSIDKDLKKSIRQSDGTFKTPYEQAKRYNDELPYSEKSKYIVVSNFKEFHIHDMEKPHSEPEIILLENLYKEYHRMFFLVDESQKNIQKEKEISLKAGELVGLLYEKLLKEYNNPTEKKILENLNILCVRLVFLLYAEDSEILGKRDMFYNYLNKYRKNVNLFRSVLIELFKVLNQKPEDRDPYLDKDLLEFPYINGGLFSDDNIIIPRFTEEIIEILLDKTSINFDWSEISPTIFGAVFESTLNPETRRKGGMHYTSIENIHKVINPLFLENLEKEFNDIKNISTLNIRKKRLLELQKKLASLTFLDPACGSGNFLTETYLSLRRLENKIIKELNNQGQITIGEASNPIKVSLKQFYGIEINDFAVVVSKTALWIAEAQMFMETMSIVNSNNDFLPLKSYTNIIEANSLRIDWEDVIKAENINYIIGNPPFIGGMNQNKDQKEDMKLILKDIKAYKELDYVLAWYVKAANLMKKNNEIIASFVSTNSICQGQQVTTFWKYFITKMNMKIDFAYRSFIWESEANQKAHVYCVIIAFSHKENKVKDKLIIESNGRKIITNNINPYLMPKKNIFIESLKYPISNVNEMKFGSMPRDGGNFIFTEEEKKELEKENKELSDKYLKKYIGAREFINRTYRWVLWLVDADIKELRKSKIIRERIEKVKEFRENSKAEGTRKYAKTPTIFCQIAQPKNGYYIAVPRVSSEGRKYIPIGFFGSNVITSDANFLIMDPTLFEFSILNSDAHMIWLDKIGGKLETRYRYSKDLVYNTFSFPKLTDKIKDKLEKTAQKILDVREKYADSSYADLYDPLVMPEDLRKAHYENDKAVWEAYGRAYKLGDEDSCFEFLCNEYEKNLQNI